MKVIILMLILCVIYGCSLPPVIPDCKECLYYPGDIGIESLDHVYVYPNIRR